jgi:hypothetical protein
MARAQAGEIDGGTGGDGMKLETALAALRNLGVSLNDYDSNALDTMRDFVSLMLSAKAPPLTDPDRVMWQYGKEIRHYTEQQVRDYAAFVVAANRDAAEQMNPFDDAETHPTL